MGRFLSIWKMVSDFQPKYRHILNKWHRYSNYIPGESQSLKCVKFYHYDMSSASLLTSIQTQTLLYFKRSHFLAQGQSPAGSTGFTDLEHLAMWIISIQILTVYMAHDQIQNVLRLCSSLNGQQFNSSVMVPGDQLPASLLFCSLL